jgi:hypothetical protein
MLPEGWQIRHFLNGKLIEHLGRTGTNSICWKYSSESVRRQLESWKDNEPFDVAGVSSSHSKHSSCVWQGHVLFDYQPSRSQIGFTICWNPKS